VAPVTPSQMLVINNLRKPDPSHVTAQFVTPPSHFQIRPFSGKKHSSPGGGRRNGTNYRLPDYVSMQLGFNAKSRKRKGRKAIRRPNQHSPLGDSDCCGQSFSLPCYREKFCFFNNISKPASSRAEGRRSRRKQREEKFLSADSAPYSNSRSR
jgi:hypothetical protein